MVIVHLKVAIKIDMKGQGEVTLAITILVIPTLASKKLIILSLYLQADMYITFKVDHKHF